MYRKILITIVTLMMACLCLAQSPLVVSNLTVEDNPYDDGSGLIIKFEALPKEARIIEYRIYRGLTPDSLFLLGKLEVDPNSGVSGNEVTFFDKDFRPFVDIDSPAKIKREKGQQKGSPIYQALPRDLNVIGPMLDKYSLLAIINKNTYLNKTKKFISEDQELYGRLPIVHFDAILANVLPGSKYYYTVIAVDERRNFHPHAPIVSGIASDNMPAKIEKFYAVWVEDTQVLNFEFELPLFVDDVAQHSIYMIPKSKKTQYDRYVSYMNDMDEWNTKYTMGDTLAVMPQSVDNPGDLLHVIPSSYPYPSITYARVKYENGNLINVADGSEVAFRPANLDDYYFYISLDDYAGFSALSDVITAKKIDSSMLPTIPEFEVRDKPYDKGDANEIIIGKPIAALTQINYRGRGTNRRKLALAYTYSEHPHYKVKSIIFDVRDKYDNPIKTITEHYFDNIFNLNLPIDMPEDDDFKVYISFRAPGTDFDMQPIYHQIIAFDEELMQLKPGNVIMGDEVLLDYRLHLVKKSIYDQDYRIASKITPLVNLFDDYISEKYIFRGITKYDLKSRSMLIDTSFDLGYDAEIGTIVVTNLFYDDYLDMLANKITQYEELLAEDPDSEEYQWYLNYYQTTLGLQTDHPYLADINNISNPKKRLKALDSLRDKNRMAFEYKLLKTDTQGAFTESEIFYTNDGESYILPTPDWWDPKNVPMLIASIVFGFFVYFFYRATLSGRELFIRPIAGLEEIDNAIGRATEMGRPMLFVPGLSSLGDVATLAGLSILSYVTKRAAQYDSRMIVPVCDYIVLPVAQQIVKEAHNIAGRPDTYNPNDIFFVAEGQFAYVAGVNGVMIREKTATNFYMGMFFAEALIMTETGNTTGAVQIAGCDALTQIPFFITSCDYTLIGEELYAASAYLTRDPMILGTLKSQDYTKLIIIVAIFVGTILSSFNATGFINWFPAE